MKTTLKILIGTFCVAGSLLACGASNKDASEVAGMFSGSAGSLQDRVESVCNKLRQNNAAPSTAGLELAVLDSCEGAGENAIDVKKYDGLRLQQYTIGNGAETDARRSSFRLQLWFNSTLVGLAKLVGNISDLQNGFGGQNIPVDEKFIENAAKIDLKVADKLAITMDDGPIKGGLAIKISVEGLVKLALKIRVDFTLIENTLAIVVKSVEAEGLVQDFFMVILLTPFAQDTYFEAIGSIKINEILDNAKLIDSFLPKLTETLLNGLFKLDANKATTSTVGDKKTSVPSKSALPKGASK